MTKPKEKSTEYSKKMSFWERNRLSEGYVLRRGIMKWAVAIARFILLFGLCFLILQPILNKISVSFMTEADLYNPIVISIPEHFTTDNYRLAAELMSYSKAIVNSLVISLTIALLQVTVCLLVGYGFARFEFPLKKFWFACVVMLIIIPPQTIQTALFMSFTHFDIFGIFKATTGSDINLRSSLIPYTLMCLTCMGLKDGLYIYMLRQYFKSVPVSLEEAAYVDGCGTVHTFVKIMLPDAVPTIASCFLFSFVWQWTDLFYTRNFISGYKVYSRELSNITSIMSKYFARNATENVTVPLGRQMQLIGIGVFICCVPLIILYAFTQKTFVQSLTMTGSKE